jgi:solute carrier family 25 aspartate/glutamate transporter 12/13
MFSSFTSCLLPSRRTDATSFRGALQVFTNPLEIVKIRLQMQGQSAAIPGVVRQGAGHIIKQLGLLGLYRGATACLARDVPFSAIYFPAYASA